MKKKSELQPLLDTLTSIDDVIRVQAALDKAIESLYNTKINSTEVLGELFSKEIKQVLVEVAKNKGASTSDPVSFQNVLVSIKEEISKIPHLEITVGTEITEEFLYRIQRWLDTHIEDKVIIEITYDSSVIAGAKISYNGAFHDYTINNQVQTLLNTAN